MASPDLNPKTAEKRADPLANGGFYSVEFSVEKPRPLYQFKIWRSESNPLFMVVKKNSNVLPKLKTGSVLNMTYYSNDVQHPKKNMETRIGSITNEQKGRFQGHCTIDLVPLCQNGLSN